MKKYVVMWAVIAAFVLFAVMPAQAETLTYNDCYNITLGPDGNILDGGGTGYPDGVGEWYVYESGWINQWFYNGPFDPNRWKHVEGCVLIDPLDPTAPYYVDLVINWGTDIWDGATGSVAPPLPVDCPGGIEFDFIGRSELILSYNEANPLPGIPMDFVFDIMSFNPEWISIDVMGENVIINGTITHQCIPEPATMSLLALGGLAVLARRRKS